MSRNLELLRKTGRLDELFGAEPVDLRRGLGDLKSFPELSWSSRESVSSPQSPAESALEVANPLQQPDALREDEDWWQLANYLVSLPAGLSLAISSIRPGESAASVLALLGQYVHRIADSPVLLAEANFIRPSLSQILGIPDSPGMIEMLANPLAPIAGYIHQSGLRDLWVLPAGGRQSSVRSNDTRTEFGTIYRRLAHSFPSLIVELPSAAGGLSALEAHCWLKRVILVASPGSARTRDLEKVLHRLARARVEVLGTVINDLEHIPAVQGEGRGRKRMGEILRSLRPKVFFFSTSQHPIQNTGD
jgi:Mrp family chromosome partitioning ATPase